MMANAVLAATALEFEALFFWKTKERACEATIE